MAVDITTTVITITPAWAKTVLATNTRNRKIKPGRVAEYAAAMRRGDWRFTGEPIQLSPDGVLLNGQHRLMACIEACAQFDAVVVFGVEIEAMTYMDTGAVRSDSDHLGMLGVVSSGDIATIARLVLQWRDNTLFKKSTKTLRTDIESLVIGYPSQMVSALSTGRSVNVATGASRSTMGAFAFELEQIGVDEDTRSLFWSAIITGAGLAVGDPRLSLRNWLLGSRVARRRAPELIYASARGWNLWVTGESSLFIRGRVGDTPVPTLLVP